MLVEEETKLDVPSHAWSAERPTKPRHGFVRWAPWLWVGASVGVLAWHGLPVARDRLLLWLVLGMVCFSLADARRLLPRLVLEWTPFVAILLVYDLLRGVADGLLFGVHTAPQIRLEEWLLGTPVPTVWLQQHLFHGEHDLRWWDYATWGVYLTHFFATLVLAAALWTFAHDRFARYASMVCVLAVTGFATYVLFPATPPWLASESDDLPPTDRVISIVWGHIPLSHFNALFEKGSHYANNVAALPSLHAAYALLISLFLWRRSSWWARVPLALYPLAMTFALVYTAEHYLVDCLFGWLYAVVAFLGVNLVADRFAARDAKRSVHRGRGSLADRSAPRRTVDDAV